MYAYRFETTVPQSGELQIKALPFAPGELIEVIILSRMPENSENAFPLKETVVKYENPTEPVSDKDWDALQ